MGSLIKSYGKGLTGLFVLMTVGWILLLDGLAFDSLG